MNENQNAVAFKQAIEQLNDLPPEEGEILEEGTESQQEEEGVKASPAPPPAAPNSYPPTYFKNKRAEKRLNELSFQVHARDEALEIERAKNEELALALLEERNKNLQSNMSQLSTAMKIAHQEDDNELLVDSQNLYAQLAATKAQTEQALQEVQISRADAENRRQSSSQVFRQRVDIMNNIYPGHELQSDAFLQYLDENPIYSPMSNRFNADLTQDFLEEKNQLDKRLALGGYEEARGSIPYVNELKRLVDQRMANKYGYMPEGLGGGQQPPPQNNYVPQPVGGGGMSHPQQPNHPPQYSSNPNPIRSGYSRMANKNKDDIVLTPAEERLALKMPYLLPGNRPGSMKQYETSDSVKIERFKDAIRATRDKLPQR